MVVALHGYKAGEGFTSADFVPSPAEHQPPMQPPMQPPTSPGATPGLKPGLQPTPPSGAMHDFIPSPRVAPLLTPLLTPLLASLLPPWSPLERDELGWRGRLAR